jgi:hypothetical protein
LSNPNVSRVTGFPEFPNTLEIYYDGR